MENDITAEQKQEMLKEHLPYEFDMFFYAWEKLCNLAEIKERTTEEEKQRNMSLEVLLLHARCLIEFFSNGGNSFRVENIFTEKNVSEKYTIIADEANEKVDNVDRITGTISRNLSHIAKLRNSQERSFKDKNDAFNLLYIFKIIKKLFLLFQEDVKIIDQDNHYYREIHKSYYISLDNIDFSKITALEGQTSCSPNIVGSGITGNT